MSEMLARFQQAQERGGHSSLSTELVDHTIMFRMNRGCAVVTMIATAFVVLTLGTMVWFAVGDLPKPLGVALAFVFVIFAVIGIAGCLALIQRRPYFGVDTASAELVIYSHYGRVEVLRRVPVDDIACYVGAFSALGDEGAWYIYCTDVHGAIYPMTEGLGTVDITPTLYLLGYTCNKTAVRIRNAPDGMFSNPRLPRGKDLSSIISMGETVFAPDRQDTPGMA